MQKYIKYIHLVLDTDLTSQNKYMFNFIYLEQEEGWQLDKAVIIIYINPFNIQQE